MALDEIVISENEALTVRRWAAPARPGSHRLAQHDPHIPKARRPPSASREDAQAIPRAIAKRVPGRAIVQRNSHGELPAEPR
jgi:hypothetical protein